MSNVTDLNEWKLRCKKGKKGKPKPKPKTPKSSKDDELSERVGRIKASIDRINKLMGDLRE